MAVSFFGPEHFRDRFDIASKIPFRGVKRSVFAGRRLQEAPRLDPADSKDANALERSPQN